MRCIDVLLFTICEGAVPNHKLGIVNLNIDLIVAAETCRVYVNLVRVRELQSISIFINRLIVMDADIVGRVERGLGDGGQHRLLLCKQVSQLSSV